MRRALRALSLSDWTDSDAEAWWREHGDEIREKQAAEATTVTGRTVAIDLAARA